MLNHKSSRNLRHESEKREGDVVRELISRPIKVTKEVIYDPTRNTEKNKKSGKKESNDLLKLSSSPLSGEYQKWSQMRVERERWICFDAN